MFHLKESCHIPTCQCVAACCSVLQCVASEGVMCHANMSVCCGVVQCVDTATHCNTLQHTATSE